MTHPYITINGNAKQYYDSATDFANDILNVLQQNSVPVDTTVLNFQAQQFDPNTNTCSQQMVGLSAAPGATNNQPGATNQSSPDCPPGYTNQSWLAFLGSVNCQPIGANPGLDLTSLGLGAGGGVLLLGGALLVLMAMK